MNGPTIDPCLPRLYLPGLFGNNRPKQVRTQKYAANPLKFTTESSMENNADLTAQENYEAKKKNVKPERKTEIWFG
jgi:hypothetical protein